MSEIVPLRLESGQVVYIEAEGPRKRDPQPARRGIGSSVAAEAAKTFEDAIESVKPAAEAVVKAFKEFNNPAEIGLEFGIQFKTEVNAFVVTGEGTGTFKLTLKWTSDKA